MRIPNDKEPDELDELIAQAASGSKNKRRLATNTERGRQAEARKGYIPLSFLLEDPHFRRHYDIEKRSTHGNPELIRALEGELATNAASDVAAKAGNRKGGKARADDIKVKAEGRHESLILYAKELLAKGKKPHELASIVAPRFNYTPQRVRDILDEYGIKPKKRK